MADRKDYFRQVAAECRRLAEIANKPEIKQRLALGKAASIIRIDDLRYGLSRRYRRDGEAVE